MKYLFVFIGASLMVLSLNNRLYAADTIESTREKVNYSVGYKLATDLKSQGVNVKPNALIKGVQDSFEGKDPLLSAKEMQASLVELQKIYVKTKVKLAEEEALKNLAEGKAFLEKNAQKTGVKTLPSGLQYQVILPGAGDSPTQDDKVSVNYIGTLINGDEFDSSYQRGRPAIFKVNAVIKGWTEALTMMKEGAKWEIFVPADLAYGERGAGPKIGPNSTLIFEIELLSVLKKG